jgi:hypothetical protein
MSVSRRGTTLRAGAQLLLALAPILFAAACGTEGKPSPGAVPDDGLHFTLGDNGGAVTIPNGKPFEVRLGAPASGPPEVRFSWGEPTVEGPLSITGSTTVTEAGGDVPVVEHRYTFSSTGAGTGRIHVPRVPPNPPLEFDLDVTVSP